MASIVYCPRKCFGDDLFFCLYGLLLDLSEIETGLTATRVTCYILIGTAAIQIRLEVYLLIHLILFILIILLYII